MDVPLPYPPIRPRPATIAALLTLSEEGRRFDLGDFIDAGAAKEKSLDRLFLSRYEQRFGRIPKDNLKVLRRHVTDEFVDLVYLDPPFNSNAGYNVLFKSQTGEAAAAQIQAFDDTWHWG